MQRSRRHNPYPLTWEIPVGIGCAVLLTLALGVHLGNGLAHLTSGNGWIWPHQQELFASIPGILATTTTSGAAPVSAHGWILTVELMLIASLGWAAVSSWQRWGPSRLKGMATADQAEQVLGVRRLKKAAPIVRPDLHPRHRTPMGGRQ